MCSKKGVSHLTLIARQEILLGDDWVEWVCQLSPCLRQSSPSQNSERCSHSASLLEPTGAPWLCKYEILVIRTYKQVPLPARSLLFTTSAVGLHLAFKLTLTDWMQEALCFKVVSEVMSNDQMIGLWANEPLSYANYVGASNCTQTAISILSEVAVV